MYLFLKIATLGRGRENSGLLLCSAKSWGMCRGLSKSDPLSGHPYSCFKSREIAPQRCWVTLRVHRGGPGDLHTPATVTLSLELLPSSQNLSGSTAGQEARPVWNGLNVLFSQKVETLVEMRGLAAVKLESLKHWGLALWQPLPHRF